MDIGRVLDCFFKILIAHRLYIIWIWAVYRLYIDDISVAYWYDIG